MCFVDSDEPTFCDSEDRIARKEHRCCECRVIIGRGEKYESTRGVWSGKFEHFKTCTFCAEKRLIVTIEEQRRGCDGTEAVPPFGHLRRAWREYQLEYEYA